MSPYLLALSIMLYAACLPLDAVCVQGRCSDWPGWSILAFGDRLRLANIGAAVAATFSIRARAPALAA
jgi:hypothetical protein